MTTKKTWKDDSRARLLSFWEPRPEFGAPIGCVTTTYTFQADFFEEQCLSRFAGIESDPQEDDRAYLIEREEKLSQVMACVLVDASHVPTYRSLRWHVLPVRVNGGILHAKVTVLAWEHAVRLLIGSANLTNPGYRQNFENMACLEFGPESTLPTSLLLEGVDFLDDVRERGPGGADVPGPQAAVRDLLASVRERVAEWPEGRWPKRGPWATFVPIVPKGDSLFEQVRALWGRKKPQCAWVLSPFFDQGDGVCELVEQLESVLVQRGYRTICLATSGRTHPDGVIELDLPEAIRKLDRGDRLDVALVEQRDGSEELRPLHAKSLWLSRVDTYGALYVVGSSNFTHAGTGVGKHTNIEANLAYVIDDEGPFYRACANAYPAYETMEITDDLRLVATADQTPEGEGTVILPPAFGAALFDDGQLMLEIVDSPPADFSVRGEQGPPVLSGETWRQSGCPRPAQVTWDRPRPPTHLFVSWTHDGTKVEAIWTVNVVDVSALPPPDELRELNLNQLLEVLTSARPVHEVVSRLLARQEAKASQGVEVELDPHKKIDVRGFLLRRMRRIARALEGLKARIERPVYTIDALRWRLTGPLGPVALAERLAADEGDGAAFMIAEVALTVRGATLALRGQVSGDEAKTLLDDVVAKLEALASAHPASHNLQEYVKRSFKEVSA